MESLDLGVQNRVSSTANSAYITKPNGFQPVEVKRNTDNKRTFDKSYCQTVQAYFAPNFIKAGEKPCSVTEYSAKLKAAGLKDGQDYEVKGYDTEYSFGLNVILKDTCGRVKKATRWENGLENENYLGYEKYSYNPLDPSYKKISSYSRDNKLEFVTEKTKAISQSDFTKEGLNINMKPEEYAEILKSQGKKVEIAEQRFGENLEDYTCIVEELDEKRGRIKGTSWYYENDNLIGVEHLNYDENENAEKSLYFYPDGTTEMTHYFN